MNDETETTDGELTERQKRLVNELSLEKLEEIDKLLLANVTKRWRKVAMVVGLTITQMPNCPEGIPDIFYALRVRQLIAKGYLEAVGNINRMRFSEVRLYQESEFEVEHTPDRSLTNDEKLLIEKFSDEFISRIDEAIIANSGSEWRKVIGVVMMCDYQFSGNPDKIPVMFYVERIQKLISDGCLEVDGDLRFMGRSEVRLPTKSDS